MPAHPVWSTVVTTVRQRVLRLLHQIIIWLRNAGHCAAWISHREVFAGWWRRREITDRDIIEVDAIGAAGDFSDLKANRVAIVDGEGCGLKRRRTRRHG